MLIPNTERVIVEQKMKTNEETSGLVIPKESEDELKSAMGTVVAIWNEKYQSIRKGDTVYFAKFAGDRVTAEDGKEYLILKISEILAFEQ